jgi:hypothetical protein
MVTAKRARVRAGIAARMAAITTKVEREGRRSLSAIDRIAYDVGLLMFLVASAGVDGVRTTKGPHISRGLKAVQRLDFPPLTAWVRRALAPRLSGKAADVLFDEFLKLDREVTARLAVLLDEPLISPLITTSRRALRPHRPPERVTSKAGPRRTTKKVATRSRARS